MSPSLPAFSPFGRPARYFPFERGVYQVAPLLKPLGGEPVFQLDTDFEKYRAAKIAGLHSHAERHICEHRLSDSQRKAASDFIVGRLEQEYPGLIKRTGSHLKFSHTGDELDLSTDPAPLLKLALQVQEDFSIWTYDETQDWMAYASVFFPSHWAPETKIGKDFFAVHEPVAESAAMLRNSKQIVHSMVHRGPFLRFAWGIATDTELNHHPLANESPSFDPKNPQLWVRVERQTLYGIADERLSFFTIRSYFEDVATLKQDPILVDALKRALLSMTPASRRYKGLDSSLDSIVDWLDDR